MSEKYLKVGDIIKGLTVSQRDKVAADLSKDGYHFNAEYDFRTQKWSITITEVPEDAV